MPSIVSNPVMDALAFRHAAKSFDPARKIGEADFATILEAARLSPTSFGLEAWRLVVVQDPAQRERLKEGFWGGQAQIPTASHLVVLSVLRGDALDPRGSWLPDYLAHAKGLPADRVQGMLQRLEGFFMKEFKFTSDAQRTEWAARQSYIVLGNMMTAAASLGIDSCPMEGFDLDGFESRLDGLGGYDRRTHAVACVVAFGYRDKEQPPRKRRPLGDAVVGWA